MNIEKIRSLPIEAVAEKLGLTVSKHKCCCPFHDDHHPSLSFNTRTNTAHCFACNKSWDGIAMVGQFHDLPFKDSCEWLAKAFNIAIEQHSNQSFIQSIKPKLQNTNNMEYLDNSLLDRFQGSSNEFTRALVQTGILTQSQMQHAVETYHLSTANDQVIFWQIDQGQNIREGKVMFYQADAHRSHTNHPFTISCILKKENLLPKEWKAVGCLFGQHLLGSISSSEAQDIILAIVESEKTAVICSELIPQLDSTKVIWMATGGKSNLSVNILRQICSITIGESVAGGRIILFPDTDDNGSTFESWLNIAKQVNSSLHKQGGPGNVAITVSDILEKYATAEQKSRKIDIADLIIENQQEG